MKFRLKCSTGAAFGGPFLRIAGIALVLALAGCANQPAYEVSPVPSADVIKAAIPMAAAEAKLVDPIEITEIGPTENISAGDWIVCLRGTNAGGKVLYFALFFRNNKFEQGRQSVIIDRCETRQYSPVNR
jgi:hypothetical protein